MQACRASTDSFDDAWICDTQSVIHEAIESIQQACRARTYCYDDARIRVIEPVLSEALECRVLFHQQDELRRLVVVRSVSNLTSQSNAYTDAPSVKR